MDTQEIGFYDEYADEGFDKMSSKEMSSAYLGVVQSNSEAVADGVANVGDWRNSSSGEIYGNNIKVIVLDFTTVWCEKDKVTGKTCNRYAPNSVRVETRIPNQGEANQFPKMYNPQTGNEIQELFMYALMLADHPEAGVLLYNPPVGNMKALKAWNKQMYSQIMPNGKRFPIFAYSWNLATEVVKTKQNPRVGQLGRATKAELVQKEMFLGSVKPQLDIIKETGVLAITAPEDETYEEVSLGSGEATAAEIAEMV